MSFETSDIGRVHLVHNPGSTHPDNYKLLAHRLFDYGLDYDLVSTERDVSGMQANIEEVDPQPTDIFAVMTGDGGANILSNAVIGMGLQNIVVLQPGGKANDGANSHNQGKDLFDILKDGVPARVHALDMYVDAQGRPEEMHRAMAYMGLHGTVLAARALEDKREITKQLREAGKELAAMRLEAFTSLNAVVGSEPILAEYDGRTRCLADLTFCGISRMAREGRVHANPFHPDHFRRIATPAGGRLRVAANMSLLAAGMLFGDRLNGEAVAKVHSADSQAIALHIDGEVARQGEPLAVPSGSNVTVVRSDRFINTLTVRRRWAQRAAAAWAA